jgi:hypothetical protein
MKSQKVTFFVTVSNFCRMIKNKRITEFTALSIELFGGKY